MSDLIVRMAVLSVMTVLYLWKLTVSLFISTVLLLTIYNIIV